MEDRNPWSVLAETLAAARRARAEQEAHEEPVRLEFDAFDQARVVTDE